MEMYSVTVVKHIDMKYIDIGSLASGKRTHFSVGFHCSLFKSMVNSN